MTLQELRGEIETVDRELIQLIKARMEIAAKIAEEKAVSNLPTRDPGRVEVVLSRVARLAEENDMDPEPVQDVFRVLIRMSEELQDQKRGQGK